MGKFRELICIWMPCR